MGSSAPSAQRPGAFPASCLASGPTCSSCAIASIFLSSGTTSCVLVSRGALGLRTLDPVVTSSLPSSLWGRLVQLHLPVPSSLFLEDSDGRPSCLPRFGVACKARASCLLSRPGGCPGRGLAARGPGDTAWIALLSQLQSEGFLKSARERGPAACLWPLGHRCGGGAQSSAGRQPLLECHPLFGEEGDLISDRPGAWVRSAEGPSTLPRPPPRNPPPPPPAPGRVPGMPRATLGHLSVWNQLGEVTLGLLKAISGLRLL